MGLNMPARTVVFTALRKWDGESHRWVGSGEYIQMSGRAGRRGKDPNGIAMVMVDPDLDAATCRGMVQGKASPLVSSFKLSYYTLLNLLRRLEGTGWDMEYVIAHSFSQFQHERQLPQLTSRLRAVTADASAITAATDQAAEEYAALKERLGAAEGVVRQYLQRPDYSMHFLLPGRIVRVAEGETDWGYGVIVSVMRKSGLDSQGQSAEAAGAYIADILLCCAAGSVREGRPRPAPLEEDSAEMHVVPAPLTVLTQISTMRVSIPGDLRPPEVRRSVQLTLRSFVSKYPKAQLPQLDPVADVNIQEPELVAAVAEAVQVRCELKGNPFYQAEQAGPGSEELSQLRRKADLMAEAEAIRRRMKESQLTSFREESRNRSEVLRRLGHIDTDGVVQLKVRAAR